MSKNYITFDSPIFDRVGEGKSTIIKVNYKGHFIWLKEYQVLTTERYSNQLSPTSLKRGYSQTPIYKMSVEQSYFNFVVPHEVRTRMLT